MPNIEPQIAKWREAMHSTFRDQPEIVDELEDHLLAKIASLLKEGVSAEDAVARAACQIGTPHSVAEQFQKLEPTQSPMKTIRFNRIFRAVATVVLGIYLAGSGYRLINNALNLASMGSSGSPAQLIHPQYYYQLLIAELIGCVTSAYLMWLVWPRRKESDQPGTRRPGVKIISVLFGFHLVLTLVGLATISALQLQQSLSVFDAVFFFVFRLQLCVGGFYILWVIWPWRALGANLDSQLVR